jgi:hypothetical protein
VRRRRRRRRRSAAGALAHSVCEIPTSSALTLAALDGMVPLSGGAGGRGRWQAETAASSRQRALARRIRAACWRGRHTLPFWVISIIPARAMRMATCRVRSISGRQSDGRRRRGASDGQQVAPALRARSSCRIVASISSSETALRCCCWGSSGGAAAGVAVGAVVGSRAAAAAMASPAPAAAAGASLDELRDRFRS